MSRNDQERFDAAAKRLRALAQRALNFQERRSPHYESICFLRKQIQALVTEIADCRQDSEKRKGWADALYWPGKRRGEFQRRQQMHKAVIATLEKRIVCLESRRVELQNQLDRYMFDLLVFTNICPDDVEFGTAWGAYERARRAFSAAARLSPQWRSVSQQLHSLEQALESAKQELTDKRWAVSEQMIRIKQAAPDDLHSLRQELRGEQADCKRLSAECARLEGCIASARVSLRRHEAIATRVHLPVLEAARKLCSMGTEFVRKEEERLRWFRASCDYEDRHMRSR
ncbi:MAG: hypothetical protein K2W95_35880 [Candidatus Obscuribacterales bacterium]|nr:hypothetical protein [Candidatus Obscuribacterales bacterium]